MTAQLSVPHVSHQPAQLYARQKTDHYIEAPSVAAVLLALVRKLKADSSNLRMRLPYLTDTPISITSALRYADLICSIHLIPLMALR